MPPSHLLIGFGAGLASALLYAAAASGSPLALVLLYVAPLPILLAGAGWRHYAGLAATVAGVVVLGLAVGPKTALYFCIAVGLPSWWLAYLALLARPGATQAQTEWYPVGRLVLWCAAIGALLVAATVPMVAGSLEEYRAILRDVFTKAFSPSTAGGAAPQLPGGQDPKALIDLMTLLAPGMAASFWTASSIFNLWLAGRITRASKRLVRPWPELTRMTFPRSAPLGLAFGYAASLLPGLPGLFAELFAGTFTIAFALLGLTLVHVASAAAPARGLLLFVFYVVLALQPWLAALLAVLGLAEHFFRIRDRFGQPPPAPPTAPANIA